LGQSTSVYHAAQAAQGQWLATLDGDGQNDPADIPGMLVLVRARQAGSNAIQLVAGHRVNRRDTASKRWASRFANGLRSRLLNDSTPDTGCGLKLIEPDAFSIRLLPLNPTTTMTLSPTRARSASRSEAPSLLADHG
jgi:dolichol-phosphate mannosyltransferase